MQPPNSILNSDYRLLATPSSPLNSDYCLLTPPLPLFDFPAHYSDSACFPYAVVTMNVFGRRYRASTNGQLVAAELDPMRARVLKDIVATGHNQIGDFVNLAQ